MSQQNKTKRGAASMYIVIFTAMLITIVALSFLRVMLSESRQTTNYSLSQSAYNSAMAGIEDAKVLLMKYQNCQSTSNTINGMECNRIRAAIEAENSEQDCDLIRKAHGITDGAKETMISSSEASNSASIEQTAQNVDQAYTCVLINSESPDYITKLNANMPSKMIPIRTSTGVAGSDHPYGLNDLNRIVVRWFSDTDLEKLTGGSSTIPTDYTAINNSTNIKRNQLTQDNSSIMSYISNIFTNKATVAPYLKVELIQTGLRFGLNQFYTSNGAQTNRGTLILRPSKNGFDYTVNDGSGNIGNIYNGTTGNIGFAASAQKRLNFPIDVKCDRVIDGNTTFSEGYACTASIEVPAPIVSQLYNYTTSQYVNVAAPTGRSLSERNSGTTFLRISLPYRTPETTVVTQLMHCDSSNSLITDSNACSIIYFSGVQPIVDSTGRANDLFRRVESRLEMVNTYFPYPEYALTVSGDDGIKKDYWVTENCFSQSSSIDNDGNVVVTTSREDGDTLTDTATQKYKKCYNTGS